MKRILLFSLMSLFACAMFNIQVSAQETNGDKVSVKITRDGKIITDTVFQLKEGQDPEAVKKVIAHVLEGDVQVISGKEGHQKMVWVTSEDDSHMWHAEEMDVTMDSLEDHPEEVHQKVIVKKGPGGEETVTITSADEIEITEEGDSKVMIITVKGDKECENHTEHIKVFVEGDDDMEILEDEEDLEWVEEEDEDVDEDNVDVYVIKKDDGTKVVKKVRVEVRTDEDDDKDEVAEPKPQEPPKPEKKK